MPACLHVRDHVAWLGGTAKEVRKTGCWLTATAEARALAPGTAPTPYPTHLVGPVTMAVRPSAGPPMSSMCLGRCRMPHVCGPGPATAPCIQDSA